MPIATNISSGFFDTFDFKFNKSKLQSNCEKKENVLCLPRPYYFGHHIEYCRLNDLCNVKKNNNNLFEADDPIKIIFLEEARMLY